MLPVRHEKHETAKTDSSVDEQHLFLTIKRFQNIKNISN